MSVCAKDVLEDGDVPLPLVPDELPAISVILSAFARLLPIDFPVRGVRTPFARKFTQ